MSSIAREKYLLADIESNSMGFEVRQQLQGEKKQVKENSRAVSNRGNHDCEKLLGKASPESRRSMSSIAGMEVGQR